HQPVCIGKKDENGTWLFPVKGALDANDVAVAIGERLLRYNAGDGDLAARVAELREFQKRLATTPDAAVRIPYFCSGCPHNSSTKIPDGARAYAGIGCHYMVQWMDRGTEGFTQMGGEGANWIGESFFSKRPHVFQNIGDGTFNHSGIMAIRWAVAAGTNMTFKLLYNDAVAMTGGQRNDGNLTPGKIARLADAEGISRIAVVTDEPEKYGANEAWPAGTTIHHRDDLDAVQRELQTRPGVTMLIYDQTCAAEKRRRRKRGTFPDPERRVVINPLVCEGCGDCSVQSNCVSVQPLDTEFGRKRTIDQSSCNKDFSCLKGFCPSFVTVHGGKLKSPDIAAHPEALAKLPPLPQPKVPPVGDDPFGILVTGVGGTGVVTIGAIIGMAAHIEGKGCGSIDMAGLAQKGGAVLSHIKLSRSPETIHAIRVAAGQADLVLGCDLIVSGSRKVLAAVRKDRTSVVVNTAEVYPGDFTRNADWSLPAARIRRALNEHAGENVRFLDATKIATSLLGNSIATNMFMLGYAWQLGLLPLEAASIEQAIELNGQAVGMNLTAFLLGRHFAHAPDAVEAMLPAAQSAQAAAPTLDDIVERRARFLTAYQDEVYAQRYRARVEAIRKAEAERAQGKSGLAEAVAHNLFKLMAIKDEYEVARLYTDGNFARQIARTFEGDVKLEFHLAPPVLARRDPNSGLPRKSRFGPWMMTAFKILASLKGLRGKAFDIFGYSAERRRERALIAHYENTLDEISRSLDPGNHAAAVAIAALPEKIRGYGYIKEAAMDRAKTEEAALMEKFRSGKAAIGMAAE
ncbi:MAG: indolepyruvate ferredoxin oxidoreductase family protein, partial [Beijerinckiaceae bacterium]